MEIIAAEHAKFLAFTGAMFSFAVGGVGGGGVGGDGGEGGRHAMAGVAPGPVEPSVPSVPSESRSWKKCKQRVLPPLGSKTLRGGNPRVDQRAGTNNS